MQYMMQVLADVPDGVNPEEVLKAHTSQEGCIGGRVLLPKGLVWDPETKSLVTDVNGRKRVQVFFEDAGQGTPLPDGCRRVLLPENLRAQLTKP